MLYEESSAITVCPAVIFAPKRKLRVIGRTEILVVSTVTRNGDIQFGDLAGSKCASHDFGSQDKAERIILIHKGRANVRVKSRCLDKLKI